MSQSHPAAIVNSAAAADPSLSHGYAQSYSYTDTYNGSANSNSNQTSRFPPSGTGDGLPASNAFGQTAESYLPQPDSPLYFPPATNFSNPTHASRAPATQFHYNKGGRSRTGRSGSLSRQGPSTDDYADEPGLAREPPQYGLDKASRILGGETGLSSTNRSRDIDAIASADGLNIPDAAKTLASPAFFSKRTSSLVPLSRNLEAPSAATANNAKPSQNSEHEQAFTLLDPQATALKPPGGHSRSSSIGAISDSFRNLNRWSASTVSSRGSRPATQGEPQTAQPLPGVKTSFSRRGSVDSIALLAQQIGESPRVHQSPRKLVKRRPSNASIGNSPRARAGSGARAYSPPPPPALPPNLPQIITLPSLELSIAPESPASRLRPSPSAGTPSSLFPSLAGAANVEPNDYFGDELTDRNNLSPGTMRANAPALLPPASVMRDASMSERRGHTRNLSSSAAKGSADSTKRDRNKQPSQKAMLSKALAKANSAVQLDNAQNYEGARESYNEACDLLQLVLARTNGDDDKKKLEAIRRTYTSRIEELDGMLPIRRHISKALPARPDSSSVDSDSTDPPMAEDVSGEADDTVVLGQAVVTRLARNTDSSPPSALSEAHSPPPSWQPSSVPSGGLYTGPSSSTNLAAPMEAPRSQTPLQSTFSSAGSRRIVDGTLAVPMRDSILPAPLSPRRPLSPAKIPTPEPPIQQDVSILDGDADHLGVKNDAKGHARNLSHESVSWLDPIDESGGSAASSVHSRTSSYGVRRKHIRGLSGDTEAEFDTALDAAIEAAYDDGYEPMESAEQYYDNIVNDDDVVANAMRKVELAKERVRQTEREAAIELARDKERQRLMARGEPVSQTMFNALDSDEEEEHMLEQMTKGYVIDDFTLEASPNQAQPKVSKAARGSDSSEMTQRTWHSSMGSNPPTATTVLSTVTEVPPPPPMKKAPTAPLPPPPHSTPKIPLPPPPPIADAQSVRMRRLSGQNAKQLKIETKTETSMPAPATIASTGIKARSGSFIAQQRQALSARPATSSMATPSSPVRGVSPAPPMASLSPPPHGPIMEDDEEPMGAQLNSGIRKIKSSSSLRSPKGRPLSVSNQDYISDLSPQTPSSNTLTTNSVFRQAPPPGLPTPLQSSFRDRMTGGYSGLAIFDADFHSPTPVSPGTLKDRDPDMPLPLEPCPSDATLRPFWLMRALYQTLVHPRGGYITNRLFVPRDAWKVQRVKLKSIEDKVSQCDLLTAALLKLAQVDSNDADAVLEEMQAFESIFEQVQIALVRRLGGEVGTQGIGSLRDKEDEVAAPEVSRTTSRSASVSGKGGGFSWRRLRSKGSAANLTGAYGGKGNSGGSGNEIAEKPSEAVGTGASSVLASLPMVANASSRPAKRDVASAKFDGPWANYMASLARLFDAAQTVDMIARQVEDPGLRHADKTQVGLELCTRHAAEFFGFYVCRFVLSDLTMLLDKHVKRASEWVLN